MQRKVRNAQPLLHVEDGSGDGPPVVLLHGVFMDSSLWDGVVRLLPGRRTVRIDMPWHGASPDLPFGASVDEQVDRVEATLVARGLRGVVLVGHSWGGMVGLRLADRRPDLVAGVMLCNTPLRRTSGAARIGFHTQSLLLACGLSPHLYGRMAGAALMGAEYRESHPQDVAAVAQRTRRMGRRRLRATLRSVLLEPDDSLGLLASLCVPWMAVAGEDDYVLSGGVREAIEAVGRLDVCPGGHASPLEHPSAVVSGIEVLLGEVEASARLCTG